MIKYFGECTTCNVWCEAPKEFKETKHFMICPRCDGNMYLSRSEERPTFFREKNEVKNVGLRLHRG